MKYDFLNQLFLEDDEFEDLFKDFDFNLLESPEFKEDAVREEIVFPILKKLGYSASSNNKIIRSKNLTHPFCYFGTKKEMVNIIPDYTFQINGENKWILDAKRPTENIISGKNVSQAYSYAIHQEIRSEIFCLCNGKEISIFNTKSHEPLLHFHIKDLKVNWNNLEMILGPEFIQKPFLKNFKLDLGLFIMRTGTETCYFDPMIFPFNTINAIAKLNENEYSVSGIFKFDHAGYDHLEFMGTFDFKHKEYQELLSIMPKDLRKTISESLSRQPFKYFEVNSPKFCFNLFAILNDKIINNENESYLPLLVDHVEKRNCQ